MPARSFAIVVAVLATVTWVLVLLRMYTTPAVSVVPLVVLLLLAAPLAILGTGWLRRSSASD